MSSAALALTIFLSASPGFVQKVPDDLPSDAELLNLLKFGETEVRMKLSKFGERLFPAYQRLLSDKVKNAHPINGRYCPNVALLRSFVPPKTA